MIPFKTFILILLLSSTLAGPSIAEEEDDPLSRELYLTGSSVTLSNMGLQYKKELSTDLYLNVGLVNAHYDYDKWERLYTEKSVSSTRRGYGDIEVGLERRAPVYDRLSFIYGLNLVTEGSYEHNSHERREVDDDRGITQNLESDRTDYRVSPGLGFNAGAIFELWDNIMIATQVTPSLTYDYEKITEYTEREVEFHSGGPDDEQETYESEDTQDGFSFNLNSRAVRFAIVYRGD